MIRILFIHANNSIALFNNASQGTCESNDYLTDSIFLEIKENPEFEVYECPHMSHMYENSNTKIENITGYGFTLRKKIKKESNVLSIDETILRIRNVFFDLIITDSRTMNPWWFNRGLSPFYNNSCLLKKEVLSIYPKNKIIFIDGEDQPDSIQKEFYGNSLYFKRELIYDDSNLLPIGYSFPKKQLRYISSLDEKINSLSHIVPGIRSTYIFNNEEKYYNDYKTSFFGLTWRKLGWDCFRHHEIISSSCLPIFPDINEIPKNCMIFYPKNICSKILNMDCVKHNNWNKSWLAHDLYYYPNISINDSLIDKNQYTDYLNEIIDFYLKNSTTEKTLNYILNKTK
jgi:hypothetical protein